MVDQQLCHEKDLVSTGAPGPLRSTEALTFTSVFVRFRGLAVKNNTVSYWLRPQHWMCGFQGSLGLSEVISVLPSLHLSCLWNRAETLWLGSPTAWVSSCLSTRRAGSSPHSSCEAPEPRTPPLFQCLGFLQMVGPSE